jgi:hypothetical protein
VSVDVERLRDRPTGEVVGRLMSDVSLLVRQELALAQAEMREKGKVVLPGLGLMGAATIAAMCAAGALTAFVVLILALFLDAWLAALLTALGMAAGAAGLALIGKERVKEAGAPVPEETIESMKEDLEWLKTETRSDGR